MFMVAKYFFNGITMNDIGKGAHVINHSHGKCMVGAFDKMLYEGFIWTGPKAVLYFFVHK